MISDTEKFAILYFLHSFVLSNVETVVIPRLHFDLIDSGRYKDFPWGSLSFEDLARSLNNRLKTGGQFYLIQGMPLAIQDPPPRKSNEHSKKKQKVDSSTPVVKKSLRKKQVDSFDEHTQTRTPTPRAAKADGMKTPIFKPIPTRQASSSKTAKEKQTTRVIFSQVHSKPYIHVEEVIVSKPESHVDKQAFISKKDFDAFRAEEQVEDIEADKATNIDEGGLEQSGQHFSPDVVQSPDNIFDGTKQQHADKDPEHQNMDYVGIEKSPQRLSLEVDQELESNLLGCAVLHSEKMNVEIDSQKLIPDELLQSINLDYLHSEKVVQHDCQTSDEKIDETILSDSQFTILDEMLPSLNVYQIQSIIIHPLANRLEESHHEILDANVELDTKEQVRTPVNTQEVTNDEQRDEKLWRDSQNTIPYEFLPSLNVYNKKSIIIHPSANREVKTSRPKLRIRRPSKFKESPYTEKFGSASDGGQEHHLMEYINGFRMHAAVPWHTVEDIFIPINIKEKHHWVLAVLSFSERCIFLSDSYESSGHYAAVLAEIEKIAKIILLCLQVCDFYVKKGIDHQSHSRYKDKGSSDMFDVLFQNDLPQQPSGNLNCGVFMVMYAECLSYGHKFIAFEFDPNALRTRYATLLWDYGIRKQEANVISDVEAPVRPARQSRITSVTEVVDV
ncbi:hypothetical protein BC332_04643 [Capsicum chinense]|nr:hypothetical protein BC332_04643 [Capsicum chinense]